MDAQALDEELTGCSADELQYIHDTQQDLYDEDELAYISDAIERKRREETAEVERFLPSEIECEKCGGPNPFDVDICRYCGWEMNKNMYFKRASALARGEEEPEREVPDGSTSYAFHYAISVLIPLVGFTMGAVFLTKDDDDERSVGKTCIALGVASCLLCAGIVAFVL